MKFSALTLALPIVIIFLSTTPLSYGQNDPSDYLPAHNRARRLEGQPETVPPLTWNDTLADYARRAVDFLVHNLRCQLPPYFYVGMNLYVGSPPVDTGMAAVYKWVREEEKYYDCIENECKPGHECRNYLQVVWGRSTTLGCAAKRCGGNGKSGIICYYWPHIDWPKERPYECIIAAVEAEEEAMEETVKVVDGGGRGRHCF